ncbi:transglutaminase-like domain-containing protein [Petralouisia muris]|uniref:transglutaminase-like domain-containing protein n=1 Tax=Petralouisia muris TaxID=3032872 RepID=UPI00144273D8|nr:transglutaminase-like domain-containing protein [Petralouisia muris]
MKENILEHYRKTGTYTYAGAYGDYFRSLPDDISELGRLVCSQVIHRVTLQEGNSNANANLIYGDMERYPWYRMRCEDDVLLTAPALVSELFRLDARGFVKDRKVEDKIVVTCRYVSVLMSAILKAKGIPARCRAGFAPYFQEGVSMDHWVNQYYSEKEERWITFDADGFYEECGMSLSQYDIPPDSFDWAADAYLAVRNGKTDGNQYIFADRMGTRSLPALIRYLLYDFHALMNNELTYSFLPACLEGRLAKLSREELEELDYLAERLLEPDRNFDELCELWQTERKFRIINSPLVGTDAHDADWGNS